jgi:hypothetical protein
MNQAFTIRVSISSPTKTIEDRNIPQWGLEQTGLKKQPVWCRYANPGMWRSAIAIARRLHVGSSFPGAERRLRVAFL